MNLKILLIFCIIVCGISAQVHRQKRHLRFPKGAQFVVTIAITTFLPKDVPDGFGHVIEFDYGYPFPEKVALDRPKPEPTTTPAPAVYWDPHLGGYILRKNHKRMKRSRKEIERRGMIKKLRKIIESFGYDGPNCISRFQCEMERLSWNRSILEDIIQVLFKPVTPHTVKTCKNATKSCPISLLQLILHSEQMRDEMESATLSPENFFTGI